ncbi:MAG: hypothetical protein Q9214_002964 [Letrouitia sp. 1 TL-2023]
MTANDDDRTVDLWESPYDLGLLSKNDFNFCIAKSVIDTSGNLTYNMVWQSLGLSPRATVTWTVQYGLNWTLDVPTGNAKVTIGGQWQACDPGEVFDLNKLGLFEPSSVAPKPGFLKVGKNHYIYDIKSGVHIIVGVRSPGSDFEPHDRGPELSSLALFIASDADCVKIYLDTTELGLNMSSWYQPQEKAQWWYEKDVKSATMITGAATDVCNYDLTHPNPKTNTYYVSTTYVYDEGTWSTSDDPPPSVEKTGLMGAERMGAGDPNGDLDENDLDKIRKDVKEIMGILNRFGGNRKVQGASKDIFYGLLKFGTAEACAHGTKIIANKLIDKGYGATVTIEASNVKATVTITPPPKLQHHVITGNVVPQQIITDWNAAVKADSADNPTNGGVGTTKPLD